MRSTVLPQNPRLGQKVSRRPFSKNIRPTLHLAVIAISLMTVVTLLFVWPVSHPGTASFLIGFLWYVGHIGIGGITMTALLATDLVNSSRHWWQTARVVSVLAAPTNVAQILVVSGVQGRSPLFRDIFASAILVVVITVAIAGLGSWLLGRNWRPGFRIAICGLTAIAMSGTAIFLLLLIHCTSGDCL